MADARNIRDFGIDRLLLASGISAHELWQTSTGNAGVYDSDDAASSGVYKDFKTVGQWVCPKATGFKALKGGRAYWDYSANNVTYKKVNDRDFYVGRFTQDAESGDTNCEVDLNADPGYDIDLHRHAFLSVPTGTQVVGAFGYPKILGSQHVLELTATNEAQCIDLLSVDRFDKASNAIIEAIFKVDSAGSTSAVDINIGTTNGTSTTDADAITEQVLIHIDGGSTAINAQSKDGTTTVAATDTTTTFTAGSAVANRKEIWIDTRDPTDVQIYADGVLVLTATVFDLSHATGPLGLLAHIEKTSSTATGKITIEELRVRYAEQ